MGILRIAKEMDVITLRLHPEKDLLRELRTFVNANEIEAATIISGTGHLTRANIQFPDGMVDVFQGNFHMMSLSGVLSCNFGPDLKIVLSDESGRVFGGSVFGDHTVGTSVVVVIGISKTESYD